MRYAALAAALTASLGALLPHAAAADDGRAARLVVADHLAPVVHVVDLATGGTLARYDLGSPARLYPGPSGRYVFAVQKDAGLTAAIDAGLWSEGHGDHGDLKTAPPALLPTSLSGSKPVHFVAHDGRIALFNDGDGTVAVFEEAAFVAGRPEAAVLRTGAPQHGVAMPFGGAVAVSRPHPADRDKLPVGIDLMGADGAGAGAFAACPDLHGEAALADLAAFACADGLLLLERGGAARKLPHPDGTPADVRAYNLQAGRGIAHFLGDWGKAALVAVDPAEGRMTPIPLPAERLAYLLDGADAARAFALTADGAVHRIDVLAGRVAASATVTGPYAAAGGSAVPRPKLAVAGEELIVSDPARSRLLRLDAETLAPRGEIALPGAPSWMVAVTAAGDSH